MYLVLELQSDSYIASIPYPFDTRQEAEAKFHAILATAAMSEVPVHSAVMLDEHGFPVRPPESYTHVQPAPEPEPGPEPEPEPAEGV